MSASGDDLADKMISPLGRIADVARYRIGITGGDELTFL
jgi:hypothetical protein